LTITDIRTNNNYALRNACYRGHLEVIKYLIEKFHLTITDIRTNNNYALQNAYANVHLGVVKYLIKKMIENHVDRNEIIKYISTEEYEQIREEYIENMPRIECYCDELKTILPTWIMNNIVDMIM
jgi:hypothetical protein